MVGRAFVRLHTLPRLTYCFRPSLVFSVLLTFTFEESNGRTLSVSAFFDC